ncbi:hypothetical protein CTheo_6950 [Ceratobasidium theobromae]|uniref:Uncharacterized protein n=1 Tax=Ceratobasidium theobromae TaxID=1582974 RepID=A0A5N5QD73_9AGAM|nr:hypothetical protein CTheo_6950 [Ceratobasidium theobromae]
MPLAPIPKSGRLECPHPPARKTPTSRHGAAAPATFYAQVPSTKAQTGSSGSTHTPVSANATTRPLSVRTHPAPNTPHHSHVTSGDHGYGEGVEVIVDPTGMAYLFTGEPLVARDAKVGPYHVNVKGKHKILSRRSNLNPRH